MESFDLLSSLTGILIKISISYILLGLFTLIAVEAISSFFQLRSKFLKSSLQKSFADKTMIECIYNHPLIKILGENQSYIDRDIFSHALMDCLNITDTKDFIYTATQPASPYYTNHFVQGLCVLSRSATKVEEVRKKASFLYNDFVHKISNGYKRKIQKIILAVATAIVIILNIDSIKVFKVFSTNAFLQSVVHTLKEDKSVSETKRDILSQITPDALPIGWPNGFDIASAELISMEAGWLITIVFTSFAAQFLYSRYINVRKPEAEKK